MITNSEITGRLGKSGTSMEIPGVQGIIGRGQRWLQQGWLLSVGHRDYWLTPQYGLEVAFLKCSSHSEGNLGLLHFVHSSISASTFHQQ